MQDLLAHVKTLNDATRRWVAAGEGRFATTYPEDREFWVEQGISTIREFKMDQLKNEIWDGYKDANGIRPRHMDLNSMSMEELERTAERVRQDVAESIKADEAREAAGIAEFEAQVVKMMDLGATDRKNAVDWLMDAMMEEVGYQGVDGFEYENNLPYGYLVKTESV